jgi:hypothetical protein
MDTELCNVTPYLDTPDVFTLLLIIPDVIRWQMLIDSNCWAQEVPNPTRNYETSLLYSRIFLLKYRTYESSEQPGIKIWKNLFLCYRKITSYLTHLPIIYPTVHWLIYSSIYPSIRSSNHPPSHLHNYILFACLPTYLPTSLSVRLSVYLYIHIPTYIPTYPSSDPSIYLFVYGFVIKISQNV